ncbi:hypothetical protein JTB14_029582 [Gonioctena quinquepunctata]|nr:hypothetical protein JTB14_029582 [Gonioctena quinquepunctata]
MEPEKQKTNQNRKDMRDIQQPHTLVGSPVGSTSSPTPLEGSTSLSSNIPSSSMRMFSSMGSSATPSTPAGFLTGSSPPRGLPAGPFGVRPSRTNGLHFEEPETVQSRLCVDSNSHIGKSPAFPESGISRSNLRKREGQNQRPWDGQTKEKKARQVAASATSAQSSTFTGS